LCHYKEELMTASRVLWAVLAIGYAAFWLWYGGSGTPLSPEEVERHMAVLAEGDRGGRGDLEAVRRFAEGDDGREFYMMNLVLYREHPEYPDGRDRDLDPREVDRRYTGNMVPKLLSRASHPVALVETVGTVASYEGATPWERAALVRYRSRRDFFEIVATPEFAADVVHKWAAIERTQSFPTRPIFPAPGPRFVLGALLLGVGTVGQALLRRRAAAAKE
jgi:hypothetical protein